LQTGLDVGGTAQAGQRDVGFEGSCLERHAELVRYGVATARQGFERAAFVTQAQDDDPRSRDLGERAERPRSAGDGRGCVEFRPERRDQIGHLTLGKGAEKLGRQVELLAAGEAGRKVTRAKALAQHALERDA